VKMDNRIIRHEPKSQRIRPTQKKVKEAIFNIIQSFCHGSVFLDLCCGTGTVGIEAKSRGAANVYFVDSNTKSVIKNLRSASLTGSVWRSDAVRFVKKTPIGFDIIYFDPPWHKEVLYTLTLKAIFDFDILNCPGILICEHRKSYQLMHLMPSENVKVYHYGDTHLTIYEKCNLRRKF